MEKIASRTSEPRRLMATVGPPRGRRGPVWETQRERCGVSSKWSRAGVPGELQVVGGGGRQPVTPVNSTRSADGCCGEKWAGPELEKVQGWGGEGGSHGVVCKGLQEVGEWTSQVDVTKKNVPEGRNRRCHGPESGGRLSSSRDNQDTHAVGGGE